MKKVITLFALAISIQSFAQEAKPVFADGQAQVVEAFKDPENWIREDLWVETEFDSDGDGRLDRMHVDVTRPRQTETEGLKLPIVYESSPYYSGTAGNAPIFWGVKHELGATPPPRNHTEVVRRGERPVISNSQIRTWVPRGYIVVHSSSPGTGLSDGSPTVGGDNESLAPKAVIEWLSGKDNGYTSREGDEKVEAYWSTGIVGMTGTSYNGTIPLAAATTGVDALKAIIPIAPNTSYYHYYRSHGLVRSPGGYLGEDIDVLYDFIHSGKEENRERNNRLVRDTEMMQNLDRITGDYNYFWMGRDYIHDMPTMKAALLMSHGFNDWNVMPEHSYRIAMRAKEMGLTVQIYYHQAGHGGPPPIEMMNKWFTKYLHGIDNGVENDPKAWIVREGDKQSEPTAYADYPNPDAADVTFNLTSGGNTNGGLTLATASNGREKLTDDVNFDGKTLATAAESKNRLLYLSPTLKEDVHISGLGKMNIKIASSKPAANLSVWLVSLPWQEGEGVRIYDNIITRGWADPQNHNSLIESDPLIPGEFYSFSFDLQPDDHIIKAGQQIGLMIFSSDQEFTLHPEPGTELTIDLSGTSVVLPIVGGKEAVERSMN